jgi:hypothetical protein
LKILVTATNHPIPQVVKQMVVTKVSVLATEPSLNFMNQCSRLNYYSAIIPVDCPAITKDCPPDCDCRPGSNTCARPAYRGMIRDNDLRAILVDMLPAGCHLTVWAI